MWTFNKLQMKLKKSKEIRKKEKKVLPFHDGIDPTI